MSNINESTRSSFRLSIVVLLVITAALLLLWRSVDLHVLRKDFLQHQGDARYLRVMPVVAHRGMIQDRNGEPLAISTPVDSVWVQPQEFIAAHDQWPRMAKLLGMKVSKLEQRVLPRKQREFVYIKRHIAPQLAAQVMALEIPGVSLQREYHRYYPAGEVTAHVLGFTNVDDEGQEGLELAWNDWLQGVPGAQRVLKDRMGRVVKHIELIRKAHPGKDLTLSLDRRLQYLTYRELKRMVIKQKARSGSAVILDSRTGEVLAMVNQPSYNPNNRGQLRGVNYRNRAVTDVFEPGSTVKPFTVAAALESGKYQPQTLIDTTPGVFRIGRYRVRDVRNYGRISVSTVIQKSSNVGVSKMALAIEPDRLWNSYARVGFGETTGSGFPGEVSGVFTRSRHWRDIERATLAYGYGVSVTPLQLARAYMVLANDGRQMPVRFLPLAVDEEAVRVKQVIPEKIVRAVRLMMESVVQKGGTATRAAIPGYRVAGKTGTMKKAMAGGYSDDRYVSVFAGMAPASDPRLVMVVMINEPRGDVYYGGEVAAPVFAKVMSGALRLMNVTPDDVSSRHINLAALPESLQAGVHP
ncbi:Cell division protein FtsI [Peptidoglycan synthetase] [hydrothermal vent metagenome]|uniref:Cell division protein FtsI [Peptidoglycan synthetase] n=1 Tax=hydrothermal vent metagenome TaxID=652676 RepID=A0A3B1AZQ6_9ZZZZ